MLFLLSATVDIFMQGSMGRDFPSPITELWLTPLPHNIIYDFHIALLKLANMNCIEIHANCYIDTISS